MASSLGQNGHSKQNLAGSFEDRSIVSRSSMNSVELRYYSLLPYPQSCRGNFCNRWIALLSVFRHLLCSTIVTSLLCSKISGENTINPKTWWIHVIWWIVAVAVEVQNQQNHQTSPKSTPSTVHIEDWSWGQRVQRREGNNTQLASMGFPLRTWSVCLSAHGEPGLSVPLFYQWTRSNNRKDHRAIVSIYHRLFLSAIRFCWRPVKPRTD